MVVLGNPPYSGHSVNKGKWITELLHDKVGNYLEVDGKPLVERNPKWLNNNYVRFIRFAQWRIERTGYGILAFITDNSYLDSPTFRGMRQSLMHTFNDIYILDLHGNSKKQEHNPDGTRDENVFDITQGVAIGIFVKRQKSIDAPQMATIHHSDLWGLREVFERTGQIPQLVGGKYYSLAEHDVKKTEWTRLLPHPPYYLFVPQEGDWRAEYEQGWKVTEMMSINVLGFQTHRDFFAIDFDEMAMLQRMSEMREKYLSDKEYAEKYELTDNRDWHLTKARHLVRSDALWQSKIIQCLYRPFDRRYCYFSEIAMDYPRVELRQHMLQPNMSLNVPRQTKADQWRHALVANTPTPAIYTEVKDGSNVFPLYLYPNKATLPGLDEPSASPGSRRPNLSPSFIATISAKLNIQFIPDGKGNLQETFGPEDIFHYMYAIFHSPTYRSRYAEFLKIDFPRLPLTSNTDLFSELCQLGERLVALHLMEQFGVLLPMYPVDGNHIVEKVEYLVSDKQPEQGRIFINKTQYFDSVPQHVWEFHIGGYQVCHKWLKDRKGRVLSFDDIRHYQRIVAALAETITLMAQIDEAIEEHGGWPIE